MINRFVIKKPVLVLSSLMAGTILLFHKQRQKTASNSINEPNQQKKDHVRYSYIPRAR